MTARLGRGLGSLIPGRPTKASTESDAAGAAQRVALADIRVNPHQPRAAIHQGSVEELIQSIKEHGILQPLIVTPRSDGGYELIAGERRLQSARILGLTTVPVVVREATQQQKLELALVENLQRKNLNPLEEAEAFQKLLDEFNLTQEAVAKRVGKSRSHVANTLRLRSLPNEVKKAILEGTITEGHAKVILSLATPGEQLALFQKILQHGLSVRAGEALAGKSKKGRRHERSKGDPELKSHEDALQRSLGTKVTIEGRGQQGKILIDYYSREELESLIKHLTK